MCVLNGLLRASQIQRMWGFVDVFRVDFTRLGGIWGSATTPHRLMPRHVCPMCHSDEIQCEV